MENTKENAIKCLEDAMIGVDGYDASKILEAREEFRQYGADSKLTEAIEEMFGLDSIKTKIDHEKEKLGNPLYKNEDINKQISIFGMILEKKPDYIPLIWENNVSAYTETDLDLYVSAMADFILDNVTLMESVKGENLTGHQNERGKVYDIKNMCNTQKNEFRKELIQDMKKETDDRNIFGSHMSGAIYLMNKEGIITGGNLEVSRAFTRNKYVSVGIRSLNAYKIEGVRSHAEMSLDHALEIVGYFKEKGCNPYLRAGRQGMARIK